MDAKISQFSLFKKVSNPSIELSSYAPAHCSKTMRRGGGEPIMITDAIADELSFERLHPTRYDEVKMMPFCMPE